VATEARTTLNGWDLDRFQETIAAVEENPESGKVTWRGHVAWDGRFGLDAHADEIKPLGQVIRRRFTLRGDHPPELLGENTGPTAVEPLLAALGSCIAGTYAAHATARGVALDELEVEIESEIDLNGFLQLAPTRAGPQAVKATVRVRADADDATLDEIGRVVTQASPVYDSVARPVPITSAVERVG
jgi:uncharacterized OsmC-like protein